MSSRLSSAIPLTLELACVSGPSHFICGERKLELPEGISVIGGELGELEPVQRRAES